MHLSNTPIVQTKTGPGDFFLQPCELPSNGTSRIA